MNSETTVPRPLWNNDWDGARARHRRLPARGRRERLVLRGQAEPRLRREGEGHGRPEDRRHDPRVRRPAAVRHRRPRCLDRELGRRSATASRTSRTPAGSCRAGTSRDLLAGGTKYHRVFRFWTGDDTDASVVIDERGDLYVASEYQRFNERSKVLGQLMKLDPSQAERPHRVEHPRDRDRVRGRAAGAGRRPRCTATTSTSRPQPGGSWRSSRRSGKIVWELQIGAARDRLAGGRRRRADPGRLHGRPLRLGPLEAVEGAARACGRCSSPAAWNRRRPCGTGGSTSGPGPGSSTGSPTPRR